MDLPIVRHPNEVLAVESIFEEMPWVIKSAFSFAKLYIIAWVIANSSMNVVMVENYYHSVFAHCLVLNGYTTEELRSDLNSSLFDWPMDLPQPTLILYLSASCDIRLGRLAGGGEVDADDLPGHLRTSPPQAQRAAARRARSPARHCPLATRPAPQTRNSRHPHLAARHARTWHPRARFHTAHILPAHPHAMHNAQCADAAPSRGDRGRAPRAHIPRAHSPRAPPRPARPRRGSP